MMQNHLYGVEIIFFGQILNNGMQNINLQQNLLRNKAQWSRGTGKASFLYLI